MRRERGDLAVKLQRLAVVGEFEAVRVAPAREPLQQFGVGQNQCVRAVVAVAVRVGDPLDEFPVGRRKQFLLVRGADDEVNHVAQRARLFARARTRQKKLHGEAMTRRFLARPAAARQTTRSVARGVSSSGSAGGESQCSSSCTSFDFLLGLLGLGETVEAGVRLQFRRHGAFGAQKQKRQFLQARLALRVQQARPPVRVGKIRRESESFSK